LSRRRRRRRRRRASNSSSPPSPLFLRAHFIIIIIIIMRAFLEQCASVRRRRKRFFDRDGRNDILPLAQVKPFATNSDEALLLGDGNKSGGGRNNAESRETKLLCELEMHRRSGDVRVRRSRREKGEEEEEEEDDYVKNKCEWISFAEERNCLVPSKDEDGNDSTRSVTISMYAHRLEKKYDTDILISFVRPSKSDRGVGTDDGTEETEDRNHPGAVAQQTLRMLDWSLLGFDEEDDEEDEEEESLE
jgi:hypothetical protein